MAQYTYSALEEKYGGWGAPTARLLLDGEEASANGWRVRSVECETGVELEAGICEVLLGGVYDAKNSKFTCVDQLVLGTKVEVKLGYIVTSSVFQGFLYAVDYELAVDREPVVRLCCMDVKGAMMGGGRLDLSGAATYKEVIRGFFTGKVARGYKALCGAPNLSDLSELDRPVSGLTDCPDDYEFMVRTAERFGLEYFVSAGKLLFRKKPSASSPLIELSPQCGILSITTRLSSTGYVGSVSVWGGSDDERDADKKRAAATVENPVALADDGTAAAGLLGGRALELFAPSARDDAAAQALAEGQLRRRQALASEVKITLRGLPELEAGKFLQVGKISPGLNGMIYIVSVLHRMSEDGFETQIRGRREG